MHWTKIPTNLLINRLSDQELISIVKYQLLWADLEYKPDDKTASRYLTSKQLTMAKQWQDTIETQVTRDIRCCETNRNSVKLNYLKNKEKYKNLSISLSNSLSNSLDKQIREDKIREDNKEIYKESFEEFWKLYPKQRACSKEKAYKAYCKAIKEKKITVEKLKEVCALYAQSDEVKSGYAKGCAAWLNDERYNTEYKPKMQTPTYPPEKTTMDEWWRE